MFLSKLSLKNPVMISLLTLALLIFGLLSMRTLGVELIPTMDIPVVTVTTIYPGADAQTIEEDVVKKIEDSIGTLSDIKHIDSTALDNVGFTIVTFEDYVNGDLATQNVRDKVSIIESDLPEDAEDSKIEQFDINAQAVMTLILKAPSGEKLSKVTRIADKQIKNRLQSISGVGSVDIYGGREREIRALLDPLKIGQLRISALDVLNIMGSSSIEVPAGTIKLNNETEEVTVNGFGEVETVEELRELPLLSLGGDTLRVKDLARVEDGLEEEESASMLDLTPAVALKVKKQGSVNLVKMADDVMETIKKIEKQLPEGYEIEISGDQTPFTKAAVSSSISDIFMGALLAMFIIFCFLMNKRAAIIIGVSLPTSIIGTFLFVKMAGFSLNLMTTMALSISVGILTDDAIVVIEAIFRHVKKGKTRIRAAIDAVQEVGLAVISAEMALICVFGPTVVLHGIVGNIFKEFGLTVVAAILISVTVSFTVSPLLAAKILKEESKDFFLYRIMDRFLMALENGYAGAVKWALRHRFITLLIAFSLFAGGLSLAGKLPTAFMPDIDRGEFDVSLELPNESSLDHSKAVAREVTEALYEFDWESFVFSTMGGGTKKEKNIIQMRVMMTPKETRATDQFEAMRQVRERLQGIAERYNGKLAVKFAKAEGMETSPVQVNVVGNDFSSLSRAAEQLVQFMKQDGGFTDITSTDKGYKKDVRVNFDHQKMVDLGVNPAETGITMRALIDGRKISGIMDESGEEIEIRVYIDDPYQTLDNIRNIPLKSATGAVVKLSDVAEITYGTKLIQINRLDRIRKIGIISGLAKGHDIGTQAPKLTQFAEQNFPPDVELKMAGDIENMEKSFGDLLGALAAAIFLIYIVLASQFNSYVHPFTIMSALPFALTGAIGSLFVFSQIFSIMSFIGIIMLMGIVTKNSILLVDYSLQLIRGGMDVIDALVESSRVRLRPILMTAGGTMVGMMPLVLSTANAAEFKHSMGYAVIGGLVFSTCVTLFVVPVLFSLLQRFSRKIDATEQEELNKL